MTQTTIPGKTRWESDQYRKDHGKTAATAIGYQLYARHLHEHAAGDMALLGLTAIPEPRPQMWPVTQGTDEERRARVDAFARCHGITAGPDEASGTYRAVLAFGPVSVVVYTMSEQSVTDRVAAITGAARQVHEAVFTGSAA